MLCVSGGSAGVRSSRDTSWQVTVSFGRCISGGGTMLQLSARNTSGQIILSFGCCVSGGSTVLQLSTRDTSGQPIISCGCCVFQVVRLRSAEHQRYFWAAGNWLWGVSFQVVTLWY